MPSKIKSRVNKKYSKRRRNKKVTKRTTRVKRGKGPGTKQLIPIGIAIAKMYDTMYVNSHGSEDDFSNKEITPTANYEDETYIQGQIEEFDRTIRQPLLTSKYGIMFLHGPTMTDRWVRGYQSVDNITKMLTELSTREIATFEDLEKALKLAQRAFNNITFQIEKVKGQNKPLSDDAKKLTFKSNIPATHAYQNYVTPAEGKRRPSLSEMPIMFDS